MKKIIYSAAAMALAFFAASCQQESLEPVGGNTVTYTVQVPDALSTKALGDELKANTLIYEVYRKNDIDDLTKSPVYEGTAGVNAQGVATLQLEFVKNQKFIVLFWAQYENQNEYVSPYTTTDLRQVTLNTSLISNDTFAAVFAGVDTVSDCLSSVDGYVTLTRPIAQLNIATSEESLSLGNTQVDLYGENCGSYVKVSGLSTTYNVATKKAGNDKSVFEYAKAAIPQETIEVNGTEYTYVAMNYVGFASDAATVDTEFTIYTSEGEIKHKVNNVPVKPNYRTNIIGNLITAFDNYNVTLDEAWGDAGKDMTVLADGLVKNINGDYEVSTAAGLAYAINNLFVDANGVANTATFYVKPGLYDMAQQAINDITVTSGTLKVYDTEAVVTRSVTIGGVVITGLSKPLIQTVEEEATVFFSGITVQGFEGEDQDAALVQNNEGKVVLADCAIVDENGNVDEETDLVGGNDPVEVEKGDEEAGELIYTAAQLAAAFADEEAESIVLGADITLENTLVFPEGRTATLDLRGWKLMTAENMPLTNPLVAVNGDLTITDSYGIGGITASKTSAIQANHGGKLTINCNVTAHEATVRAVGGEAIISGGKYVQTGTYYSNPSTLRYTIDCRPDDEGNVGKLTIAGGEFVSNNGVINAGGEITINGGTFNNDISEVAATRHMMYVYGSAVVNINGGEFFAKANAGAGGEHICVYTSGATVNIAGGKFTSLKGNGDPNSIISEYSAGSAISVTGGEFNTKTGLTKYIHKDYKAVKNADGCWVVITATVKNEAQLKEAFELSNEIVLGSDITLTENWTPVGTIDAPFNGIFEGNGKTISGLKVENTEYAAFIAYAGKDAVIKNLTLENVDIKSTKHAAGVVCIASEGVTLENVTVSGTIVAASYAGGLLHNAANAVIKNCVNNATVSANRAGGIASWVTVNATIENVENNGNITGAVGASGIAHGFAGSVKNATNNGVIISNNVEAAAGIVGVQKGNSTYEYCYNDGDVTSTYDNPNSSAAGILGQSAGSASTLKYCANYGTVSAEQSYAAGIAYSLYGTINASYCYNAGTVSGADGAGAIAPKAQYGTTDKASYCLNSGKITSSNGTVYQGSNQNVSSYYYDGTTLKNVADNAEIAEADALAVLNGGTDNDFFSTENGKITVK